MEISGILSLGFVALVIVTLYKGAKDFQRPVPALP